MPPVYDGNFVFLFYCNGNVFKRFEVLLSKKQWKGIILLDAIRHVKLSKRSEIKSLLLFFLLLLKNLVVNYRCFLYNREHSGLIWSSRQNGGFLQS